MAQTIQSLERGLKILDILGAAGAPLHLNEIAAHFSLNRSSVFRLVTTLVQAGYVIQDAQTRQYSLGLRVLELSSGFNTFSQVETRLRPVLKQLRDTTGQNAHLGIMDGADVVFLAVEQPLGHLSLTIGLGTREPLAHTALGRAILAFLPEPEKNTTLDQTEFTPYTEKSVTSRQELEKILEQIAHTGLAEDDEEFHSGIHCLAAPIFDQSGNVAFSLGISGLCRPILSDKAVCCKAVLDAGSQASRLLGFRKTHPAKTSL